MMPDDTQSSSEHIDEDAVVLLQTYSQGCLDDCREVLLRDARIRAIRRARLGVYRQQARINTVDVEDAWVARQRQQHWRKRGKEFLTISGGLLTGSVAPGIVSPTAVPNQVDFWVALVGIALIFIGLLLDL